MFFSLIVKFFNLSFSLVYNDMRIKKTYLFLNDILIILRKKNSEIVPCSALEILAYLPRAVKMIMRITKYEPQTSPAEKRAPTKL
jgi:hypothetical protein